MQMSARLCYALEEDEEKKKEYLHVMREVARFITEQIPKTRAALEAREDYNAPFLSYKKTPLEKRRVPVAGDCPNYSPVRAEADSFFVLQDAVDTLTVLHLCPGWKVSEAATELYLAAIDKIDFCTHVTSVPVQMLEAYYYE